MSKQPKILFIFDGGDAPGYMSVATALTEKATHRKWKIFAAQEGFRSLTENTAKESALVRIVWDENEVWKLRDRGYRNHPVVALHRRIYDAGCNFRSERFRGFSSPDKIEQAARYILSKDFQFVVGIGGNGTFQGIKKISEALAGKVHTGFINCSVDSDILGDRSVGFTTGIEEGARIARGLFEDAFTHKRIYILEMMGNRSGKHALHAGGSARAHLIVLPDFKLSKRILRDMTHALDSQPYALVVVAEGYADDIRSEISSKPNAAVFFLDQLSGAGLLDLPNRRVIAEPFSRYLRGVRPGAIDVEISVLKSHILLHGLDSGKDRVMAYFLNEHEYGLRPFDSIETDNTVEEVYLNMIDRIGVATLRAYVSGRFSKNC